MLFGKIILIILLAVKAAGAIFFLIRDYKNLINKDEIKTAIQNKNLSKIKAIFKTLWDTVKSVKFASLILDIITFVVVWFAL